MFNLNPFAISNILTLITYIPLFILIALKGKTKLARMYTLHILTIIWWGITGFLIGINKDPKISLIIWEIAYSGVIFIPVTLYHSVMILTNKVSKGVLFFIYAQGVFFLIATWAGKTLLAPKLIFNSFYFNYSSTLFLFSFIIKRSIK